MMCSNTWSCGRHFIVQANEISAGVLLRTRADFSFEKIRLEKYNFDVEKKNLLEIFLIEEKKIWILDFRL